MHNSIIPYNQVFGGIILFLTRIGMSAKKCREIVFSRLCVEKNVAIFLKVMSKLTSMSLDILCLRHNTDIVMT